MSNDHPAPGFGGFDLDSQLWMQSHLDVLRRDYETRIHSVLATLIEAADDAQRLCDDASFRQLPGFWQDGLKTLHAKLLHRLSELGVTRIATIGAKVDPRLHQVIEVVPQPGDPETIVGEELAGYLWNDQLLRAAKVVSVAQDSNFDD